MKLETKTGKVIRLTIDGKYYRALQTLRICSDNKRSPKGRPITNDWVYQNYRTMMERLVDWLLDQTKDCGYRTAAFKVIGWENRTVILQETDNPFDAFWANNVIDHISDQYRFGGLLEQWNNDP